jgi:hypothetical protein
MNVEGTACGSIVVCMQADIARLVVVAVACIGCDLKRRQKVIVARREWRDVLGDRRILLVKA